MIPIDSGGPREPIASSPGLRLMLAAAIALFLAFSISSNSATAQSHIRTIALTGQQAPGFPVGAIFQTERFLPFAFSHPIINSAGNVAFSANVQTVDGVVDAAYKVINGNPHLIAHSGQSLPGVPAGRIVEIQVRNLGDDNSVFLFGSEPQTGPLYRYWREQNNQVELVVGYPGVPSTVPGTEFTGVDSIRFNNGAVAFYAGYKQPDVQVGGSGVWVFDGVLRNVVFRHGTLPGGEAHNIVPNNDHVYLNGSKQVAFVGLHRSDSGAPHDGIFMGTPDLMHVLASAGLPAPGTDHRFKFLGPFRLNDAGQIAFTASTDGGLAGAWANRNRAIEPVAIEGMQLPGLPENVQLDFVDNGFDRPLIINANGSTTFVGQLAGPGVTSLNDSAIFSEGLEGLHLVAREGDRIADMGPGVTITYLGRMSTNSRGQTAFGVNFLDSNTQKYASGIFAEDLHGNLHRIVAGQNTIEVSTGDFRTIKYLSISGGAGGEDGLPEWLNDSGQIVFTATFTDGSAGVFVSDLVAIPEPASIVIAVLGVVALVAVYQRRTRTTAAR